MKRLLEDWADLKYNHSGVVAHIVPFGAQHALCGRVSELLGWFGTGSWAEIEQARKLPMCGPCSQRIEDDRP